MIFLMKKYDLNFAACLFALTLILLTGCRQEFLPSLKKAEQSFQEKNYINAIDTLNLSLPYWKESDGTEVKAQAYELLGKCYHQLHNKDKAIEAYEKALELSNHTYDAAYGSGILQLTKSQPELALRAFQKALEIKPDDPLSLLGTANALYSLRRYREAYEAYQQVIAASPGVTEALESLNVIRKNYLTPAPSPKKPVAKKPASKKGLRRR
jgi:tetratricopeptide (TPR) repeat protein